MSPLGGLLPLVLKLIPLGLICCILPHAAATGDGHHRVRRRRSRSGDARNGYRDPTLPALCKTARGGDRMGEHRGAVWFDGAIFATDCDDYGFLGSHLRLEPLLRASRRLSLRKFNCATVNRESLRARQTVMAGTGRQSPRQAQAGGCSVKTVLQRSSMILSSLPPQMTTQLFACAFKRAAKAGEALFFAFGG